MSQIVPFAQAAAPAFIQQLTMSPEQIAAMNAGAAVGTGGGGAVNKISLKAAKFRLVVGGAETVLPVLNLQLAIVRVNDGISKVFYIKPWNPGEEAGPPDCSSDDGIRPRADSPAKQCGPDGTCMNCPQNQWGSKVNTVTGSKIKACTDTKRMAVIAPDQNGRFTGVGDLYQLSVPPASLGDFGSFVRQLSSLQPQVPYNAVVTEVAFDNTVTYPKLLFKGVRYLEADEYAAINARYNDDDTKRVASLAEVAVMHTQVNQQQALPAPVQQPVQQPAPVQQPVQQAPVQQAQQPQQQAPAGWGQPAPVAQAQPVQQPAPVQEQPQQQAPAGWGQPAPVAQPVQQPAQQQAPAQQPQQAQPAAPVAREPGKPRPGLSRRNAQEVAEDNAYFAALEAQKQAGAPQQVKQPTQQPAPQQAQPEQQPAPAGWGAPAPVAQAQPVQQPAPVQEQQAAPAGWGNPPPTVQQAQPAQQQAPVQQTYQAPPSFDASNPFAGAQAAPQVGAPIQPGVVDAGGVFAGWDDPQPQ